MKRRNFVSYTALGTAGAAIASSSLSSLLLSCNDKNRKITLALIGCSDKGIDFLVNIKDIENVAVKYIFDFDNKKIKKASEILSPVLGYKPETAQDMSIVFEDREIDGVFIFLPEHWRAPATILACNAQKDVYVDSLPSHSIREGRLITETARKKKRVVQCGFQLRNSPSVLSAKEFISGGNLGQVVHVKIYGLHGVNNIKVNFLSGSPDTLNNENNKNETLRAVNDKNFKQNSADPGNLKYGSEKKEIDLQKVPEDLNWDGWLGPAPYRPFRREIYDPEISINLNTCWDFHSGLMTGTSYGLDLARMVTGDPGHPQSVYGYGSGTGWRSESGIAERQVVTYDYGDFTMVCESGNGYRYMQKTASPFRNKGEADSLNWLTCPERVEVYGATGLMYLDTIEGSWQVIGNKGDILAQETGKNPNKLHLQNFIDSVRNRNLPQSNIEQGHLTAALAHMGNIACRVGNMQLLFDAKSETFENNDIANEMLETKYRDGYEKD